VSTRCCVPFCPAETSRTFGGWICSPHFDLVDRVLRTLNSDQRDRNTWREMAEQAIWRAAGSPMRRELRA
jgi:hypothetical protein